MSKNLREQEIKMPRVQQNKNAESQNTLPSALDTFPLKMAKRGYVHSGKWPMAKWKHYTNNIKRVKTRY